MQVYLLHYRRSATTPARHTAGPVFITAGQLAPGKESTVAEGPKVVRSI